MNATSKHTLARVFAAIKSLLRAIGNVQARIILAVFYFVVLAPFALFVRWTKDPLSTKPATRKGWIPRPAEGDPATRAKEQF